MQTLAQLLGMKQDKHTTVIYKTASQQERQKEREYNKYWDKMEKRISERRKQERQ